MLASVDGVAAVTLGDNAGLGDVHVDVATGENFSAFVRAHNAIVNALPFYLNKTRGFGLCRGTPVLLRFFGRRRIPRHS